MSNRKEYRKTWMANRRKIQRLRNTDARAVRLSDSDSDDSALVRDVPGNFDQVEIDLDVSHHTSQLSDSKHSSDTPWDLVDLECNQDLFSDCSESDTDQERDLVEGLQSWVADSGVNQTQVTKLLRTLKPFHPELPLTAETLLKTN